MTIICCAADQCWLDQSRRDANFGHNTRVGSDKLFSQVVSGGRVRGVSGRVVKRAVGSGQKNSGDINTVAMPGQGRSKVGVGFDVVGWGTLISGKQTVILGIFRFRIPRHLNSESMYVRYSLHKHLTCKFSAHALDTM